MSYSTPITTEEVGTKEGRDGGRVDSLYIGQTYQPLRFVIPDQGHQFSPKMSVSPVKAFSSLNETPRPSPRSKDQKQVTFELLLPSTQSRARLPMRVMISKHDTTDSIITTVKNFYGLYDGPGVSFQDRLGNILIAAYDNFLHGMTVYVKVPDNVPVTADDATRPESSPTKPQLGPPFEMRPPTLHARSPFNAQSRSPSPDSVRSYSAGNGTKHRSRSQKSVDGGAPIDGHDVFSDSDGGNGSVASSRRSRVEAHVSAEISVENIVEGGRRKRAKFESSELPLFVPPQVPVANSVSSVSPQRRATNGEAASPLPFTNQRTIVYNHALPSPQSYGRSDVTMGSSAGMPVVYGAPLPYGAGPQLRGRPAVSYQPPRRAVGGILPTPEPTVGSVISDEDVAIQLMRLGDTSNISHGRTSTSTLDDALSGKAELASSEESDEDDDLALPAPRYPVDTSLKGGPKRKKQRTDHVHSDSGASCGDDDMDESFKAESDPVMPEDDAESLHHHSNQFHAMHKSRENVGSMNGVRPKMAKSKLKGVATPGSTAPSRKTSLGSTAQQLGPDEEDLSAKPRCQRCRKSKKGCDRQRPCGRCKDAGIGIDGCVSEDEGNGRRGRFGRHMGVTIKKEAADGVPSTSTSPAPHATGVFLTPALPSDMSKKRKRST